MIFPPFFETMVHALGWTLLHSFWQGALAALVLLAVRPRLRTARQRYWAAYGVLCALFVAAAGTFAWVYQPDAQVITHKVFSADGMLLAPYFIETNSPESSWARFTAWLEANHAVFVALWLLGLTVSVVRLAGGLKYLHRLRRYSNALAEPIWQEKLQGLARQLGLRQTVALLESALVQAPMTLGLLKPIILLPIGLVNHLSPAEVEAVLAHELAHIARRDWFFNLIQVLLEALFYFHPAVWWIGSVIRAERENCCDDTAVRLTGNRLTLAKALVRLQERNRTATTPALALGIHGSATLPLRRFPTLLDRIRRILNQPQPSSSPMEKVIATALLLALLTLWTVRTAENAPQLKAAAMQVAGLPLQWLDNLGPAEPTLAQASLDTLPPAKKGRKEKFIHDDGDKRVEMEMQDGEMTRLNVDGKEIPPAEYDQYREMTEDLRHDVVAPMPPMPPHGQFFTPHTAPTPPTPATPGMPAIAPMPPAQLSTSKDANGNTVIRVEGAGKPTELIVKDGEVWMDGRKLSEGEAITLHPGEAPTGRSFYKFDSGDAQIWVPGEGQGFNYYNDSGVEFTEADIQRLREEALRGVEEYNIYMKENGEMGEEWQKKMEKEKKKAHKGMKKAEKEMRGTAREMERAHLEARQEMLEAEREMLRERQESNPSAALVRQLKQENLIADEKNFTMEISSREMKVNGKKQSEETLRRYLDLYREETGHDMDEKTRMRIVEEN